MGAVQPGSVVSPQNTGLLSRPVTPRDMEAEEYARFYIQVPEQRENLTKYAQTLHSMDPLRDTVHRLLLLNDSDFVKMIHRDTLQMRRFLGISMETPQ